MDTRIPYKWDVTQAIPDVRYPPAPEDDILPNGEREIDGACVIAFRTPAEYLSFWTSCIETGADILWRDDYATAQRIKDSWNMATEYPLPLTSLNDGARQTRQIIREEINRLVEKLTTGGAESIFPTLPPTAPTEAEEEAFRRLCAAAYIFTANALDGLAEGVADGVGTIAKVSGIARSLGGKGFIANVLLQIADEVFEFLAGEAFANQTNIDILTCLMLENLAGQPTDAEAFGAAYDRVPFADPVLEFVRATMSVAIRTDDVYAAWLDLWYAVSRAPLAALPSCPCGEWSETFNFALGAGAWYTSDSWFLPAQPAAAYNSGRWNGVNGLDAGGFYVTLLCIGLTVPAAGLSAVDVQISYSATFGGNNAPASALQVLDVTDFPFFAALAPAKNQSEVEGFTTATFTDVSISAGRVLAVYFLTRREFPDATGSNSRITSITISGTGVNPFA